VDARPSFAATIPVRRKNLDGSSEIFLEKTEVWDQERRMMQSQKTSKFFENSVFFSLQRLREQF